MKTDIILAGVGGQGILSIAAALGSAALTNNLYMKQAETHGMSQRGGDVQSFMRISDRPIYSDLCRHHLIRRADGSSSLPPLSTGRRICGDQLHTFYQYPQLPRSRKSDEYTQKPSPSGDYRCRYHC